MRAPSRVRQKQRASSEAAILDAAFGLLAARGPDAVSLRDVAAAAGCSHALVARYFGSKDGLVGAVAERLATSVDRFVHRVQSTAGDPVFELLAAARSHRPWVQLLVRSALGDLPPRGFPAACGQRGCSRRRPPRLPGVAPLGAAGPHRRDRLGAYAAASLLLGFVTFEGFLVTAAGLGRMTGRHRDAAVADAARHLLDAVADGRPALAARDLDVGRHEHLPLDPSPATSLWHRCAQPSSSSRGGRRRCRCATSPATPA
ncbi:MAG: helix-turn-helix domain-containing protein [Acidimicrobiales bacterium]